MACYLGFTPMEADEGFYFVSYNSDDMERIQPLVKGLYDAGVPLWYDYALEYGKEWKKQIARKINGSDAVLLLLTRGVVAKEESFVREEYDMATEFFGKTVYVVLLDQIRKTEIPIDSVPWWMEVIKNHIIDLTKVSGTGAQVREICTALGIRERQEEPVEMEASAKRSEPTEKAESDKKSEPIVPTESPIGGKSRFPAPERGSAAEGAGAPYVYISYAHRDRKDVGIFVQGMKQQGIRFWLDEGLEVGCEWASTITDYVIHAHGCIVFMSSAYTQSVNCRSELEFALAKKIPVMVVYLEDTELTMGMKLYVGELPSLFRRRFASDEDLTQALCDTEMLRACREMTPPRSSAGLQYESLSGDACAVTGWGTCKDTKLVIPPTMRGKSVTRISASAFSESLKLWGKRLTSVYIPHSVSHIEQYAFSDCKNLTTVTVEHGVASIGLGAFAWCRGLSSIALPASVTHVDQYAFRSCEGLTEFPLSVGVKTIGDWAFNSCKGLTEVTIPRGVTSIGEWAFADCKALTSVFIPDSVETMGENVFALCSNVTIYCEHPRKPEGWDKNWNPLKRPVIWNDKP